VTISTNNEEVLGVSDLDQEQASPLATDIAINKTKETIKKEGKISPFNEEIDFSLEENKAIMPPVFELVKIGENTFGYWSKKGKIKIIGKFNKDITEKMTFNLPLSFPSTNIKCEVEEATKDMETELTCKVQKGFKKVKSFVVEQRIIKKRHREIVIIKYKKYDFKQEIECENYDKIQLVKKQRRKNSNIFFLQLGNEIEYPKPDAFKFFMAFLFRKSPFTKQTINISIRIIENQSRLRNLQEENDREITCEQSFLKNLAGGYICGDDINLNDLELNTDDIDDISGIPANARPSKQKNTIDYSNPDNLEAIANLPSVEIEKINGEECKTDGSYTIEGTIIQGKLKDMSNVEIPMSSTDSSALCQIKVNNKKVTMDCQNKEEFSISPIIFESTVIKKDGKDIFLLSNYSTPEQFSCIISTTSEEARAPTSTLTSTPTSIPTPVSSATPGEDEGKRGEHNRYYSNISSKGLRGGAIAGIIIACSAAVAIVSALIVLIKKGVFTNKNAGHGNNDSENSASIIYQTVKAKLNNAKDI
jgi:hypothetical protein